LDNILLWDKPDPAVLFNTILYRFFNRPDSYRAMGGFQHPATFDAEAAVTRLENKPGPLFSPAYRVTTVDYVDSDNKHKNILYGIIEDDILAYLDDYVEEVLEADTMEDAFWALTELRGVGEFLVYELVVDLNYRHLPFSENDFVNFGP